LIAGEHDAVSLSVRIRYCSHKSLTISLFSEGLPCTEIEKLVSMARKELGSFEDGTSLPEQRELNNG
jgi:hypothetical protein